MQDRSVRPGLVGDLAAAGLEPVELEWHDSLVWIARCPCCGGHFSGRHLRVAFFIENDEFELRCANGHGRDRVLDALQARLLPGAAS